MIPDHSDGDVMQEEKNQCKIQKSYCDIAMSRPSRR